MLRYALLRLAVFCTSLFPLTLSFPLDESILEDTLSILEQRQVNRPRPQTYPKCSPAMINDIKVLSNRSLNAEVDLFTNVISWAGTMRRDWFKRLSTPTGTRTRRKTFLGPNHFPTRSKGRYIVRQSSTVAVAQCCWQPLTLVSF